MKSAALTGGGARRATKVLFYFDLKLDGSNIKQIKVLENESPREIVERYSQEPGMSYKTLRQLERFLKEKIREH